MEEAIRSGPQAFRAWRADPRIVDGLLPRVIRIDRLCVKNSSSMLNLAISYGSRHSQGHRGQHQSGGHRKVARFLTAAPPQS